MMKEYLGDSVYVDFDGYYVVLTTQNDDRGPSNMIMLEPQVLDVFDAYRRQLRKRINEFLTGGQQDASVVTEEE